MENFNNTETNDKIPQDLKIIFELENGDFVSSCYSSMGDIVDFDTVMSLLAAGVWDICKNTAKEMEGYTTEDLFNHFQIVLAMMYEKLQGVNDEQ